jgi:hypothetical protein
MPILKMCRLFDLHQLITRTSRSIPYCAFRFSNDAQEGATLFSDNRRGVAFYGWLGFWFSLAKR